MQRLLIRGSVTPLNSARHRVLILMLRAWFPRCTEGDAPDLPLRPDSLLKEYKPWKSGQLVYSRVSMPVWA